MNPQTEWPRYAIFGTVLATDFQFDSRQILTQNQADLLFTCQESPPFSIDWSLLTPLHSSKTRNEAGHPELLIYEIDDAVVFRIQGKLDFYRWPDRIICHLPDRSNEYLAEYYLLNVLLPIRLENAGILNLHASATVVAGAAIGFLATSFCGKTSLAASFVAVGYPLLTDDILAVQEDGGSFLGLPAYPQMRMWPEQAQHFLGRNEHATFHPSYPKKLVSVGENGFGTFCDQPKPLRALYLPERVEDLATSEIRKVSRPEAMFLLIQNHRFVVGFHRLPQLSLRLDFLQKLACQVPLFKLRYPAGYDRLPQVRQQILHHLNMLDLQIAESSFPHELLEGKEKAPLN